MRSVVLALLLVLAPLPARAGSRDAAAGAEPGKLRAYLATHDVSSKAELTSLAAKPETALMAIAEDAKAGGLVRARAVASLRLFPSPSVQAFLERLIGENASSEDPSVRLVLRRAAVTLGWMPGPGSPARLDLLFDNEDADVRLDAAIGLGLTRSASAGPILRKQLAVEQVDRVKTQIERQLRALSEALVEPPPPADATKKKPMRTEW